MLKEVMYLELFCCRNLRYTSGSCSLRESMNTTPWSVLSTPSPSTDCLEENLKCAFRADYIDPRDYAAYNRDSLFQCMDKYVHLPSVWVAPYTSLVTSSMMGKTRLIKELSRSIPTVYICLRKDSPTDLRGTSGYPRRTPTISEYLLEPIKLTLSPLYNLDKSLSLLRFRDKDCMVGTAKMNILILSLVERLSDWIGTNKFYNAIRPTVTQEAAGLGESIDNTSFRLSWLWLFFAEPDHPSILSQFWKEVTDSTTCQLKEIILHDPSDAREEVHRYLLNSYPNAIKVALQKLKQTFRRSEE